jgi:hypothetical protein
VTQVAVAAAPVPRFTGDEAVTVRGSSLATRIDSWEPVELGEYKLQLASFYVSENQGAGRPHDATVGDVVLDQGTTKSEADHDLRVNAARVMGVSLTVGTVWWALRAGGVLASVLASLPAWRQIDLLPILRDEEDEESDVDWGDRDDPNARREEQAVDEVLGPSSEGNRQ